jgi:hypothetical protein
MARKTEQIRAHAIPSPRQPPAHEGLHEDLFDWEKIRHYTVLSLGSVRRRWLLFIVVAAGIPLLAAGGLAVLPKTYEVTTRILAQRNPVLAVRADTNQMEPTKAAVDTITSHDNLRSLIQQTDLLREWRRRRAPAQRWKDSLERRLGRAPTEDELTQGLVGLLQKQINVWVTPDGTVTIKLHWQDPLMAYRLVDAAQQNFLEKRHVLEVSTIAEQITILEGHAARLKKDIDAQVAELQRLRDRSGAKGQRPAPAAPTVNTLDPEAVNVRVMLDAKRRAIADLEEFRQRHLIELQTRLTEQRAIYSENHPIVTDLQRSIELLKQPSPQLAMLRQEEAALRRQLADSSDDSSAKGSPNLAPDIFRDLATAEDSTVEYARSQLRYAVQQYAAMRERIDAANIDLDTARAAFKYRYSVVTPPEIPRGPIKPKKLLVLAAALVAGLLLALFATTAADLRSGLVLERWQLEDLLSPPQAVLGVPLRAVGQLPSVGAPDS